MLSPLFLWQKGSLEGFVMLDSENLFLPCFPVFKKSIFFLKSLNFSLAPYPLPVFGLRGIKWGALASYYFFPNPNFHFCLLHLFSLWSSILHYTNLSNLSCFTPVNGRDGSVQLFLSTIATALRLDLVPPPCLGWDNCPYNMVTLWMRFIPGWPDTIVDKSRS